MAGTEHNRRELRIGGQELPRLLNQLEPTAALGDAPARHAHEAAGLEVITGMLHKVGRRFSTRSHPGETWGFRLGLLAALLAGSSALAARPYRGGVVATAHPAASEAALAMLNRGGNAVDAAIAAAFTLAVVDPTHSGLGGGGFALLYDVRSRTTQALDFREIAPAAAGPTMYVRNGKLDPLLATDGALAVAVPGAVAGYFDALSRAGTLKPAMVIAPAIRAARRGVVVTPMYQRLAARRLDCLRANREAARIFLRPNAAGVAEVPPLGTLIAQPQLAATLERLAKEGARSFYRGKLAQS
ncbi:MAG TPA: gamma-glutamyltransferase, partial [Myxococcaceae bacterium]|nr:gamma-glutamyltransferase [Myxococcaceae bacterium]